MKVTLEPIEDRAEPVPEELAGVLADDPAAAAFFSGLSGFYRRQYAEWVVGAKQPEPRQRRAAEAAELLRQGHRSR